MTGAFFRFLELSDVFLVALRKMIAWQANHQMVDFSLVALAGFDIITAASYAAFGLSDWQKL